ncbi:MAG: lactate racemase domain-containing protein [Planctomycetota bacterium]
MSPHLIGIDRIWFRATSFNAAHSPWNMTLPDFFSLSQRFASRALEDVEASVARTLTESDLSELIRQGQKVGIAVGSRGITNLDRIVGEVVRYVTSLGGEPVIIPAMGSHGGATSKGQIELLAGYGVSVETLGCSIDAAMETVSVGMTEQGATIHFSEAASRMDHVIVVNRVKPHTRLSGRYESGLIKMLMIGLGKHHGASLYHQIFRRFDYSLNELAPPITSMIIDKMPITMGLAIVEDAFEQTALVEAVPANQFLDREPELLNLAKEWMPQLPFDDADLLIVDQIGKEISGTGMDTNVIGRKVFDKHAAPGETPKIRQIYVRSLTEKTNGNACGIGLADYCHRDVVSALNEDVTRINCITSAHAGAGAVPLSFTSDREVLNAVLSQAADDEKDRLRWMWIKDTLHVDRVVCSRSYWESAQQLENVQVLGQPSCLQFDEQGNLVDQYD